MAQISSLSPVGQERSGEEGYTPGYCQEYLLAEPCMTARDNCVCSVSHSQSSPCLFLPALALSRMAIVSTSWVLKTDIHIRELSAMHRLLTIASMTCFGRAGMSTPGLPASTYRKVYRTSLEVVSHADRSVRGG